MDSPIICELEHESIPIVLIVSWKLKSPEIEPSKAADEYCYFLTLEKKISS